MIDFVHRVVCDSDGCNRVYIGHAGQTIKAKQVWREANRRGWKRSKRLADGMRTKHFCPQCAEEKCEMQ